MKYHNKNKERKGKIWAVVPAAGIGARMEADKPKQYIQVAGKTIIEHSLSALLNFDAIEAVQVCVSNTDEYWNNIHLKDTRLLEPVEGGATRASSVLAGLNSLSDKAQNSDWVMVHDAARPCISNTLLQRLLVALGDSDVGGILAVPIADTLKRVCIKKNVHEIRTTAQRKNLWAAQTPQMFRYGLLRECLQKALKNKFEVTDESSAVEFAGYQPLIVPSVSSNIKVTYPEDIDLVRFYLNPDNVDEE